MKEAILTLDLGTTACKAVVFTPEGQVLGEASQEYPTAYPGPGLAEQDPRDWWGAAAAAGRRVVQAASGARVVAIGLSSQRETVVPVDGKGEPLRPAITWLDRRSQPQAEMLAQAFGAAAQATGAATLHGLTGMLPEATFTATKLRWLAEHEPEVVRRAALFCQPKDYLLLKLTGAPALDPSLASRTLLWSIRGGWLEELVEWAGVRTSQLPEVLPSGAIAGQLTPEAAAALGLPPGSPVATGAGDRCCEALGAGVRPGARVMVSTGTATNVSGALDRLPEPLLSGVLYTSHAVAGQWMAEQGMGTGGSVLKWLRETLGVQSYAELDRAAAAAQPGARGLLLLPFFMGSRATRWNPAARGAWLGLSLSHGPGELARSVMEGVACEVRACVNLLRLAGQAPAELVILGGGAKSALWSQIKADITGVPVVVPRVTEAASLGAMFLAGQAVGLWADPVAAAAASNPAVTRFEPDARRREFYDRLYSLYNRVYTSVAPLYGELGELAAAEQES